MSVTVLLVLGERGSELVNETTMEHWFSSYIGNDFCTLCVVYMVFYKLCQLCVLLYAIFF